MVVGKCTSALIAKEIWDSFVSSNVEHGSWPRQCRDIYKYLFDLDLASIIELDSIKDDLVNLYNVFAKRIAIMYHQDKNLQVSTSTGSYVAGYNYSLLTNGYEKTLGIAFGPYQKTLHFNLSNSKFIESHTASGVYDWDDDPDYVVNTTNINSEKENVMKLVKRFDEVKKDK